jgi:hypothetical protein
MCQLQAHDHDRWCSLKKNESAHPELRNAASPPQFGGKLDALAIDSYGDLVMTEIKPSNGGHIYTAPFQVAKYASLLSKFAKKDEDLLRENITCLIKQKSALGLFNAPPRTLREGFSVIPTVAIGGSDSSQQVRTMMNIARQIADATRTDDRIQRMQIIEFNIDRSCRGLVWKMH